MTHLFFHVLSLRLCFFSQFSLALCSAFSLKRLVSWLGALQALRLRLLGRFQRFRFCPRHEPTSHLGEATSDTCEANWPISFHIPRQPHLLLLRVRRFRDFLGHCRRLDLKGWTFQISNSSALGPSNVFFHIFQSQHDSNTKENIRKLYLRKAQAAPQAGAVTWFWVGSVLFHLSLRPRCRFPQRTWKDRRPAFGFEATTLSHPKLPGRAPRSSLAFEVPLLTYCSW